MNKLAASLVASAVAGVSTMAGLLTTTAASAATAPTTTTTLAPPAQGVGPHHLFLYVDTIAGGGTPKPVGDCVQTNTFQRGQVVVFRMYGINVVAGGTDLTGSTVAAAYVRIPGMKKLPLAFGNHGTNSYWTAAWTIGKKYPLGAVNFSVYVVTKPVAATSTSKAVGPQSGVFTQAGLAAPSRLTVVTK